jgi:anthranilate phosphoribosyltransferase
MLRDTLEKLLTRQPVGESECEVAFTAMLEGRLSEAEIAAFLTALRAKGEDFSDLAAGARAMRARAGALSIPVSLRPLADNCGTGGDGSGSFNISTTAAIVAASLGVRIAKHGNRSISSKCGSADLLFRAGFPESLSISGTAALLEKTNFTFFFAPNFHPAMKFVGPVRKALGIRTIFNLLGPLANPISPEVQLIGVGAHGYLKPMAEAAMKIGIGTTLVVHSRDGMDEISPSAVTDCVLAKGGKLTEMTLDPATIGISGSHDLNGGDADANFKILTKLLAGEGSPCADAVALNAGALLWLTGNSADIKDGYLRAKAQISSGKSRDFFNNWVATAKSLAGSPA